MQKSQAAIASAAFFAVAPGTVVGLIPWLITRWEIPDSTPIWRMVVGVLLIVAGLVPPVHAFGQFVKAGGTPMPIAPTQRLVVAGFNRYIRNPMYFGLVLVSLGIGFYAGTLPFFFVPILVLDRTVYVYSPAHSYQCMSATDIQLVGVSEFPENVIENSQVSAQGSLFESTAAHEYTRFLMNVTTLLPLKSAR